MTGRTHDLAAITALGVVVLAVPPPQMTLATVLAALLANQIGGIAPDIDEPTAPFWRNLPVGGFFGRLIAKMLGGHRFLTHSLLGAALLGFGAYAFLMFLHPIMLRLDVSVVWFAFMVGLISHLVMDTFTKEGVPWLLPIPVKFGLPPIEELRVTTGKFAESFIVFPGLVLLNVYLVSVHYRTLLSLVTSRIHG